MQETHKPASTSQNRFPSHIQDGETRRPLGALLMVQIEQAALSRTDLVPERRRPWTVLVDEWPTFSASDASVRNILAQTRKFCLRLYLAAQSMSDISADRLQGALENCRLNILFGLGRDSAVHQSRQITTYDPELVKIDPITGRPHAASVSEQFERLAQELQSLDCRQAYVKLHIDPPVKVQTLSVRDARPPADQVERVLAMYRARYQRSRSAAEAAIAHPRTLQQPVPAPTPFILFAPSDTPK
jgi:hypothetical protein